MEKTRLSSKGQVVIPKRLRFALGWQAGQELVLEETQDGVLLRPTQQLRETTLEEVAGCLHHKGPAKSLEEMEKAIAEGIRETYGRH